MPVRDGQDTGEGGGATGGPLAGLKVLDASTNLAGPLAAQILGDYGADVIKVEHPTRGDGMRGHGLDKDGEPLWWKMISRNKRPSACTSATPRAPRSSAGSRPPRTSWSRTSAPGPWSGGGSGTTSSRATTPA
ncbi:hypothetical protein GCM10027194_37000 [Thalassiella azotivora]